MEWGRIIETCRKAWDCDHPSDVKGDFGDRNIIRIATHAKAMVEIELSKSTMQHVFIIRKTLKCQIGRV
jgi:hypothetical protein